MIKRRPNLGAHFYGRRGQSQHGLDILEWEAVDSNSVYQVRRYETLTPDMITAAGCRAGVVHQPSPGR